VSFREEADSAPRHAGEATGPDANDSVEEEGDVVAHPSFELSQTPDEPATPAPTLGNDIAKSLKQVVDKINFLLEKVDKNAKARVVVHP
jgi:hypothetical protein